MTSLPMSDTLEAINLYFGGERREALAILCGCAAALALAGVLYVVARDGFASGFGVLVLISAVLLGVTATTLLRRDAGHEAQLLASVRGGPSPEATEALASESLRIEIVIGKYKLYRYVALGVLVAALACVALTRHAVAHGVAAGLLLLVVAQMMVDHYSEQRARWYAGQLAAFAPATARP